MSLLDSFYQQFLARHDFEDSDLDVFLNRWKNKAIFKDIPVAWIIPLDSMMFELNKNDYIVNSVCQEFGQLIVLAPLNTDFIHADKIIQIAVKKVEAIDKDLYSLFDINIRKEYFNKRHNDKILELHKNEREVTN